MCFKLRVRVTVLGSGSEGNATLVEAGGTSILVDAGLPFRRARQRLEAVHDSAPEAIDGLLVTHSHQDHAGCVDVCARRFGSRVYATEETIGRLRLKDSVRRSTFKAGDNLRIGAVRVASVAIPHDAPQIALRFEHRDHVIGLVTDLGHIPEALVSFLRPCRTLLLESNHDLDMLLGGSYPEPLKRRIAGPKGHLSNKQSASLLSKLGRNLERVVLMHLSKNNNRPKLALGMAKRALSNNPGVDIQVAPRNEPLLIASTQSTQLSLSL